MEPETLLSLQLISLLLPTDCNLVFPNLQAIDAWAYALQLLAFHFQTFIASAGNQMKNSNKTSAKICFSSFISS